MTMDEFETPSCRDTEEWRRRGPEHGSLERSEGQREASGTKRGCGQGDKVNSKGEEEKIRVSWPFYYFYHYKELFCQRFTEIVLSTTGGAEKKKLFHP